MIISMVQDYGTCPCGGYYERRIVEVRMTVGEGHIVLTDVPQGACPICGSRVYKADVLARIEALMKGEPFDHRFTQLAL